jgi:hypothetical protein
MALVALVVVLLLGPAPATAFDHSPGSNPNAPTQSSDADIDEPFDRQLGRPAITPSEPALGQVRPSVRPANSPGWLATMIRLTMLGYLR